MIEVQIKGFKELEAYLNEFTEKVAKSAVASGVKAGANIVVQAAKINVPVAKKPHYYYSKGTRIEIQPGNIKRNIKAIRRKSNKASVMYLVGPVKGKGKGIQNDPWYWKFVEFGAPAHGIPANPFLRSAFDDNTNQVIKAIHDKLFARVMKENSKLARLAAGR